MKLDNMKLKGLFSRVYNNKMEEKDSADIKEYITKVFGDGRANPDPSSLHQFNQLVVEMADEIAKPMVSDLLSLFADFKTRAPGQIVEQRLPQKNKAKIVWSATGSGVDLVRVEGRKSVILTPAHMSTGFYYEPLDLVRDSVEYFQFLINDVANAKARLYLDEVTKSIAKAVTSGKIPNKNVVSGSGLTIAQYNKLASTLARYGGKPIFVADSLLIDYFAMQQATDTVFKNLLTDGLRQELLTSLAPAGIGRTTAVNLVNPFTDATNAKVELPINKGYMFAGGVEQKPFSIVEYGGLKQLTEQDMEDERIKVKITQEASISLVFGEAVGVIEEQSNAVSL